MNNKYDELNKLLMHAFPHSGAVLYGIDPSIVVIRKSRLTYGLGVLNRFVEGILNNYILNNKYDLNYKLCL